MNASRTGPRDGAAEISCVAVTGIGEVASGDDLAGMLSDAIALRDGDILVVTSKVVSKAEGRVRTGDRSGALAAETARVLATRGPTSIVRTHHGLVLAAAGIDASNTTTGTIVLLPQDPDGSARRLREALAAGGGPNVAVLVTDTAGRAWRNGQTDIAIGAAGIDVLHDYAGSTDDYGNLLAVTAPAVADEIAGAGDLVKAKLARTPAAVLRGLERLVLPRDEHGPGARALVRDESADMFGYGAREAVLRAVLSDPGPLPGFGTPAAPDLLADTFITAVPTVDVRASGAQLVEVELARTMTDRERGAAEARLTTVAHALGWRRMDPERGTPETDVRLSFTVPTP